MTRPIVAAMLRIPADEVDMDAVTDAFEDVDERGSPRFETVLGIHRLVMRAG